MAENIKESLTTFLPKPGEDFVETPYIREITSRALDYVKVGLPIHFKGPAGVGKTTLAMHVAAKIGRPAMIIYGDYDLAASDFVGGLQGYIRKKVLDNYIRTVVRAEESTSLYWTHGVLLEACKNGYTLIYDEFTRSRPETNNVFLPVLEERLLPLPLVSGYGGYLKVHADFTAIFTSNPRDYAGIQKTADALLDRMATIELGNFDEETESAICMARADLLPEDAKRVVNLVRKVREVKANKYLPSIRSSILVGKLMRLKGVHAVSSDPEFERICMYALIPEVPEQERAVVVQTIKETIRAYGDWRQCDDEKE